LALSSDGASRTIAPRCPWRGRWRANRGRGLPKRFPTADPGKRSWPVTPVILGFFGKRLLGATYRGISYSGHQPSVAAYVDAQQGWLYGYTNFNSVKFSTSPAVEVTVAAGIRPTLGPLEFDIGAA
jgi:hypothetical protein